MAPPLAPHPHLSLRHSGQGAAATRNRRATTPATSRKAPPQPPSVPLSPTAENLSGRINPGAAHFRPAPCSKPTRKRKRLATRSRPCGGLAARPMARPGTGGATGTSIVRRSEPFASLAALVSISADFESDFCKILIEICASRMAQLIKLFQILNIRRTHTCAKFSRLSSQFRLPLIPGRRNRLSPFPGLSGALPLKAVSRHLSPLASTCAAPPRLLTFRPLLSSFRARRSRDPEPESHGACRPCRSASAIALGSPIPARRNAPSGRTLAGLSVRTAMVELRVTTPAASQHHSGRSGNEWPPDIRLRLRPG